MLRPHLKVTPLVAIMLLAGGAFGQATTFQELMDPAQFPEAQFGMKVTSVAAKGERIRVVTTGAIVNINGRTGDIGFLQRIGHLRPVATLHVGAPLEGVQVTHEGEGFARITVGKPNLTIRINGDSLFMIQANEPLTLEVESKILPAWNVSWKTNHLVVDEWGGFGLYCSDLSLDDHFNALNPSIAKYPMPAEAVLCIGVCPPKPYNWERSFDLQVVWHWSDKSGYPSDEDLLSWEPYGNVVLLQSEVMLWKDWNLDFVPRLGMDEFVRVRDTIHRRGMRFIVYTSPYYFLKGTSQEKQAVNDKPGISPGAIVNGENMPLFLDAITRVMNDLKPDGLYFDGQYMENPAALYALARHARRIVGDKGLLEWHSTTELGPGGSRMYMPQADAHTDIQLRGEGQDAVYRDFDYLRFFVSGYNINNCIGVLCNNSGREMSVEMLDTLLQANVRLHTLIGNPKMRDFVKEQYRPKLTDDMRTAVDRLVEQRQTKVKERTAELKAFLAGPDWKEQPIRAIEFDSMPDAEQVVSQANTDAIAVANGSLNIRAHAHTYAYLRVPIDAHATGFVVRLRQGTDNGMSWGPAALLRFANGDAIRIGGRFNALQADVMGTQVLGPAYDPSQWLWLRGRWTNKGGIIEYSADGATYQRFFTFFRDCPAEDKATELLVGKVPYNGQPIDHTEPGEIGQCDFDSVHVYDR